MSSSKSLAALTRSLVVGSSIGAIAVAGACVPVSNQTGGASGSGGSGSGLAVSSQEEAEVCTRAISERSVAAMNELVIRFPESRCIAPLFNSLPARTLAGLSTQAAAAISPEVYDRLSPQAKAALPVRRVAPNTESATTAPGPRNTLSGGGSGFSGY